MGKKVSGKRFQRQWLRAVGLMQADHASSSSDKLGQSAISRSLIDGTLAQVDPNDGGLWVALACLDAVEQHVAPLKDDASLVRHLLAVGLSATHASTKSPEQSLIATQENLRTLAARQKLLRYSRMLDVWDHVYGPESDRFASQWVDDTQEEEGEGFDAWAELAETTPSPIAPQSIRTPALDFILSSCTRQALQIALSGQVMQLRSFLKSLPRPFAEEVYNERLTIVKALLVSSSALGIDVRLIFGSQLLPYIKNGNEDGLWCSILHSSQQTDDFTDNAETTRILSSKLIDPQSTTRDANAAAQEAIHMTASSLLSFYKEVIRDLEQQIAAVEAASQLAALVVSPQMGLQPDQDMLTLAEDLRLLVPLVYGSASSYQAQKTTLKRFRETCFLALHDSSIRSNLAIQYILGNGTEEATAESCAKGMLPLLRALGERESLSPHSVDERAKGFYIDVLLALADQGETRTLYRLLQAKDLSASVGLSGEEEIRIVLSMALIADAAGSNQYQLLQSLIELLIARSPATDREAGTDSRRLRDVLSPVNSATTSTPTMPSTLFASLKSYRSPDLMLYLRQVRVFQQASQRLRHFTELATVSALANVEADRDGQLSFVFRLVRSFVRSVSHVQQYAQLADSLREICSTGSNGALDYLTEKDVARAIVEGAARAGDVQIFEQVLRAESEGYLSPEEQEEIVLDAADELYDNSISANLHQGDMKIGNDLLAMLTQKMGVKSVRAQRLKGFFEATSRLCSFRITSEIHAGSSKHALISPIEIRLCQDRLKLIRRLLGSRNDAYRAPEMILDLATKLCAIPPGPRQDAIEEDIPPRQHVENSTLAMITDAALGQGDFEQAQTSCERLVANALTLGKRVEQMRLNESEERPEGSTTLRVYGDAKSLAHRSCHMLSKQPDWPDLPARLRWAGFALAFCPPEQLSKYLSTWRQLAQELETELQTNPPKKLMDELQRSGASMTGNRILTSAGGSFGGLGAALQAHTGGLSATGLAALSQFGGSIESYASNPLGALLGRAPSAIRPLSSQSSNNLSSGARKGGEDDVGVKRSASVRSSSSIASGADPSGVRPSQAGHTPDERLEPNMGSPLSRAARLFDGFGGASPSEGRRTPVEGQPGYLDPAERAARAARRFFSGFGGTFQ